MTTSDGASCEWTVTGMDCGACAGKVRTAVERLPGVSQVEVALMTERLRVTLDEGQTTRERVEAVVRSVGYGIAPKGTAPERKGFILPESGSPANGSGAAFEDQTAHASGGVVAGGSIARSLPWYRTRKGRLVIGTGLLLVVAWAVNLLASDEVARWAFVLATLIGVAPIARSAVSAARAGMPFTIEMLMTIAATGALFINAAEEAALVVFLFAVGEVLEGVAANKARDGIRSLASLVPKTALLEVDGRTRDVPAESLGIGQIVLVRPGDRIPADGEVIDGISGVDESPVTGESVPKPKEPGDAVFAGSINTEAALRVKVTKAAEDNTISRIIRLVEEAESARAPTERFIDRFSRIYMPAVVGVALLVAIVPPLAFAQAWDVWIYRALALLLIGCPCALVISVPASIASALSSGSRRGLLMKGGAVIEAAARITDVAFDKTGTLTHGRPRVTDVVPLGGTEAEVLSLAAAVETGSSHPLAAAILSRAQADGAPSLPASAARALPGKGAEAVIGCEPAWVASPRFAKANGVMNDEVSHIAARLEVEGKTVVAVFRPDRLIGLIALRDEPREDAAEAVRQLQTLGIRSVMLTGDNARTAAAIAGHVGIEHRAELMPEDKVAAIREMVANGRVLMVGDGINDAPALASAHVGVAMGSGTDVALETADAAILRNRATDVAGKIRLARATMANIRQNVAIALGLKAVFLVTTVLGITGLWIAILADTGATVLVTLNALRLLAFNPDREV
ncbi:heavy metal translocating P-type ATPase [Paracoccus sp. S3-43]|uniref:heavy metal translocating P-type ATPase n=1 Tax=Paracoccus sp. S3-43 TaxID=3030011 RepID=UPI0023B0A73F|nr:heavy metal translocating P-type ATPase [Paracoccus sp. S3-43]WEF23237.1 heavy metal translocating P-type ATPase [Paracoccus sp. S3-43]